MKTTPTSTTRLAAWRKKHNLTLAECAGLSGFSAPYLSRVERGQRNLSALGKVRLARALDVPIADLFDPLKDRHTRDIEVQP